MERLADFLTRHCGRLTLAILVSALIPLAFLPRLSINNSIEVWLPQGSPDYRYYQQFTGRFGSEEFVVIALETTDPLAPEALNRQRDLARALGGIPGVDDVLALPQFEALITPAAAGQKPQIRDGGFLRHLLLGDDGKTAGMVIWLKPPAGPLARRQLVEAIEQTADRLGGGAARVHLAGTPLMNVALDRASQQAAMTFLPLAIVASILVLLVMLRSLRGVLAVIIPVSITVLWTMGLAAMSGRTLNMVTVTLPGLMFALALSNGIHLASDFSGHCARLGDRPAALRQTFGDLTLPAFLTAATTAVGFGSLIISNMRPVTDLGVFAAAGIMIGFLCTLIMVPGLLAHFYRLRPRTRPPLPPHWTERTGPWTVRHAGPVVALALILIVIFSALATRIKAESNVLKFFPADSRVARDYAYVGQHLTGFYTAEIEIHTTIQQLPQVRAALEPLAQAIEARPEVARVDEIGRIERFGLTSIQAGIAITPESTRRFAMLRARFLYQQGEDVWLRVSVLVRAMNSSQFYALMDALRQAAKDHLPPGTRYALTGIVPLLNDAQAALIQTQVNTFLLAAIVILAIIGLLFRSWRVMLVAIPPNLLPIMGTFALMALLGIPMDAATVMIASIVIGIAVDNAIHFLSRYRDAVSATADPPWATQVAFSRMGRAAVFTSVVAAAGFAILSLARFRPVAEFGMLTGFTMLTSLAGDLFVLPPCVRLVRLWRRS